MRVTLNRPKRHALEEALAIAVYCALKHSDDRMELKDVILEIKQDLRQNCRVCEYGLGDDLWESEYIRMS